MLTGFHAGVSGVLYNEQKLSVISNNTANLDTPGFRRALMVLRTREAPDARGSVHSAVEKRTPQTHGIERTGVFRDYGKAGQLRQTGSDMDVGIPSEYTNAFFPVQKGGVTHYTRNGSLSVGPQDITNPNSPTVLKMSGFNVLGENGQPIPIDPALGPLKIGVDGVISQGDIAAGTIPVYKFNKSNDPTNQVASNLQVLEPVGESLFAIPAKYAQEFNPRQIKVGQAGVDRLVMQGMREGSNVNMFSELVEMMSVTKAATANTTAIKRQADSLTKLFDLIRS